MIFCWSVAFVFIVSTFFSNLRKMNFSHTFTLIHTYFLFFVSLNSPVHNNAIVRLWSNCPTLLVQQIANFSLIKQERKSFGRKQWNRTGNVEQFGLSLLKETPPWPWVHLILFMFQFGLWNCDWPISVSFTIYREKISSLSFTFVDSWLR